jgi:hypothetical protein
LPLRQRRFGNCDLPLSKAWSDHFLNIPRRLDSELALLVSERDQPTNKVESESIMTTQKPIAALALLTFTLFGCADTQPQTQTITTTTRTVKTTQTTQKISLRIGMKGSEAIAQVGIPCSPETIEAIR